MVGFYSARLHEFQKAAPTPKRVLPPSVAHTSTVRVVDLQLAIHCLKRLIQRFYLKQSLNMLVDNAA